MNPQNFETSPQVSESATLESKKSLDFSILDSMRPLPEEGYRKRIFDWLISMVEMLDMDVRINPMLQADLRDVFVQGVKGYMYKGAQYRVNEIVCLKVYDYLSTEQVAKINRYRNYKKEVVRLGTNLKQEIEALTLTDEDIALTDLIETMLLPDASLNEHL